MLVSRARKPYTAAATKSVLLFGRIPQIAKDINRDRIWVIPPKWIRNVFPVVALLRHPSPDRGGEGPSAGWQPVQSDFQPQAPKRKETFKQQPNHEYARVYLLLLVCTRPWVAHIMYGMTWRNFTPGRFFVLLAEFSFFLLRNRLTTTSGKQQSSGWKYERNSPPNAELRKFAVN